MKLKQLQNWLKQQTRQLQADQEFRKMMKEMEKDMASIDKMLETGKSRRTEKWTSRSTSMRTPARM